MFTGQKAIALATQLRIKAEPTLGLARLFSIRPGNIFGAEKVQYDSSQKGETMSQPITRGGGANRIAGDGFDQIQETPPYYNERKPINLFDLKGRAAGTTEFDPANVDHVQRLIMLMAESYTDLQDRNDRQIEFQAAEILQKGKIEFSQFNNAMAKDYDFQMNQANLFMAAAPDWTGATGAQKRAQIETLMANIRIYGKNNVTDIIAGGAANDSFWQDAATLALLDNRRASMGELEPSALNAEGFAFQGTMVFGAKRVNWWLYEGFYQHPDTQVLTPYVDSGSIIAIAGNARRDRFHAGIDIVTPADATAKQLFPGAVSITGIANRVAAESMPYVYTDENAVTTDIGIATAPLLVPTNRGGHGHLDTGL